jgi:predicted heme/steroid binding protein
MNKTGILAALVLLPVALFATTDSIPKTTECVAKVDSSQSVTATQSAPVKDTLRHFTIEELSKLNGKNNSAVYVAIDDTIYDFSEVKAWKGGKHHGNTAGIDLSEKIKKSPHQKAVLKNKKVVGLLVKKSGK